MEIVSYLNKKDLPGIVAIVDFEKCFDRIAHDSIREVFKYFRFGDYMINLIMILFTDIEVCTSNNGYMSEFINNASPMIYTFCGEILNHVVKNNGRIKGVPLDCLKNILSQFADDTGAFLKYDRISVESFGESLMLIEEQLGLKVSYEKTTMYRIGSLRDSEAQLYTQKNFRWSSEPIETLGMLINCDGSASAENITKITRKIDNVCANWAHRSLSLTGKTVIINTLMGSVFVFNMLNLGQVSDKDIKCMERKFKDFLWPSSKPRISIYTLQRKKEQGGLNLVDLKAKQKALKISWIFKIQEDETLNELAISKLCTSLWDTIWRCNLSPHDTKLFENSFWQSTLEAWAELNYHDPQDYQDILNEILWWNSHIRVGNKPIMWSKWVDKNIITLGDIMVNCQFKTAEELGVNWMDLNSICSAIPQRWKNLLKDRVEGETYVDMFTKLKASKKCPERRICYLSTTNSVYKNTVTGGH